MVSKASAMFESVSSITHLSAMFASTTTTFLIIPPSGNVFSLRAAVVAILWSLRKVHLYSLSRFVRVIGATALWPHVLQDAHVAASYLLHQERFALGSAQGTHLWRCLLVMQPILCDDVIQG